MCVGVHERMGVFVYLCISVLYTVLYFVSVVITGLTTNLYNYHQFLYIPPPPPPSIVSCPS